MFRNTFIYIMYKYTFMFILFKTNILKKIHSIKYTKEKKKNPIMLDQKLFCFLLFFSLVLLKFLKI